MIETAKQYIDSRRGEWRSLATEAKVSYDWLTKFAQGRIPEPGYYKVERICHLSVKKK